MKHFAEKRAWAYLDLDIWTAQIFWVPRIISGTGKAIQTFWQVFSQGPSEQKPMKNFGEKGAWAYPGTDQIFSVPLLSQERIKLRTSNFVRTFLVLIGTKYKSPLQISGKVAVC